MANSNVSGQHPSNSCKLFQEGVHLGRVHTSCELHAPPSSTCPLIRAHPQPQAPYRGRSAMDGLMTFSHPSLHHGADSPGQGIFLEAMVVAFAKIVIYSWQHVEWPDLQ
ncbi:hypothetical protein PVAP13_5KG484400 [Panicum virgatum]|uniref:Uncharacterized protein n=1 Tax=Panicum virgatum TaxID=38727 RepID=A0A8T0SSQ2_PANVG|nr:hypothetical protein PVAP13_5KG484400 [Panicum virgatum]